MLTDVEIQWFSFLKNSYSSPSLYVLILFSVDHLSKYLAMRLTLDLDSELPETYRLLNFCIYIAPTPGQLVVLSGNQTLRQVNDKFWKVNKPLEMFYSWKKS
jgi:E3 ubiquitin-protein ligase RNF1/2